MINALKKISTKVDLQRFSSKLKSIKDGSLNIVLNKDGQLFVPSSTRNNQAKTLLGIILKIKNCKSELDWNDVLVVISKLEAINEDSFDQLVEDETYNITAANYLLCGSIEQYVQTLGMLANTDGITLFNPPLIWDCIKPVRIGGVLNTENFINSNKTDENANVRVNNIPDTLKNYVLDKYVQFEKLWSKNEYDIPAGLYSELLDLVAYRKAQKRDASKITESELLTGSISIPSIKVELCWPN